MKMKRRSLGAVTPWATVMALVVMVIVFGVAKPGQFFSSGNLDTILYQSAALALVAAGLTVVLVNGDFDLSVGAVATVAAFAGAIIARDGSPVGIAIGVAVVLGLGLGAVNGLVTVFLNVSSFIATLAMLGLATGLAEWWSSGEDVAITNKSFLSLALTKWAGIPVSAIIALVAYIILWFALERTRPGRMLYAAGQNPEAARLVGIRVNALRIGAFMCCSALAAVAGVLLASQQTAAYSDAGNVFLLQGFAAAFLGAVTVRHGQFHVWGTFVGVAVLEVLSDGLSVVAAPTYLAQLVSGLVLIAAVSTAGTWRRGRDSVPEHGVSGAAA